MKNRTIHRDIISISCNFMIAGRSNGPNNLSSGGYGGPKHSLQVRFYHLNRNTCSNLACNVPFSGWVPDYDMDRECAKLACAAHLQPSDMSPSDQIIK